MVYFQRIQLIDKDAFRKFMKRWPYSVKPHFVADAGFGSPELLAEVATWGRKATFSISHVFDTFLWKVLSANIPHEGWRIARNENNWLARV